VSCVHTVRCLVNAPTVSDSMTLSQQRLVSVILPNSLRTSSVPLCDGIVDVGYSTMHGVGL